MVTVGVQATKVVLAVAAVSGFTSNAEFKFEHS